MQAAKLPQWARAIGSLVAKKFDVSGEPLPLEMDLVLRLMSAEEERDDPSVGKDREAPPKNANHGAAPKDREG